MPFISVGVGTAIAGAAAGGAAIYGAHAASSASEDATKANVDATNQAAAIQAKSAADTLAFNKQQADLEQQNFITQQNANYQQYGYTQALRAPYRAYGTSAYKTLGSMLGLTPSDLPDLPPPPSFQTSNYSGGGSPSPTGSSGGGTPPPSGSGPTIDPSKDIASQVSAYFKSRGVSDSETPYWVQKWSEFGKNDPTYFAQRLSQADIFGQGGSATTPSSSAAPPPTGVAPNPAGAPGTTNVSPYLVTSRPVTLGTMA